MGSTRSGHSLVGALLDAHRHAVIAHELDIFGPKQDRGRLRYPDRDSLFEAVLVSSAEQAAAGRTGARKGAGGDRYLTSYAIPGQHQGAFDDLLVIGTKMGNRTVDALRANPGVFESLREVTRLPLKLLHVIRNPFDNIAAIAPVAPERVQTRVNAIKRYFRWARGVEDAKRRGYDILDVYLEELIARPADEISGICEFLDLEVDEGYLEGCASIFFRRPNERRRGRTWTPRELDLIRESMGELSWLERYADTEVERAPDVPPAGRETAASPSGPPVPDPALEEALSGFVPPGLSDRLRRLVLGSGGWDSPAPGLLRGQAGDEVVAAVSGDKNLDPLRQVTGLVDALDWQQRRHPGCGLRYVLGSGRHTPGALPALAVLRAALAGRVDLRIEVDGEPARPDAPDLAEAGGAWAARLDQRRRLVESPPVLVRRVRELVDHPAFHWRVGPNAPYWSGWLGGLPVCKVAVHGRSGVASVPATVSGRDASAARERFRSLAGAEEVLFSAEGAERVAALIRGLAAAGAWVGDPEEHLVHGLLHGGAELAAPGGARLEPAVALSQLPAAWWTDDPDTRYADVLLRDGATPWVVDVQAAGADTVASRHGLVLVALYRHFLREAPGPAGWFEARGAGLELGRCEAAVALPVVDAGRAPEPLAALRHLAGLLGVHALELRQVSPHVPVAA